MHYYAVTTMKGSNMKRIYSQSFIAFALTLIVGCGTEQSATPHMLSGRAAKIAKTTCPLKFANLGLCSEINWTMGPSVDQESSFVVTFWSEKMGSSSGPWVEPSAQVGAFIRMTCCGSVFFPKVSKTENGKYLVSNMKFTPGKWEVYVQLKNGDVTEKQFITLNLND